MTRALQALADVPVVTGEESGPLAAKMVSGSVSTVFDEAIDLTWLFYLQISEAANDIYPVSLTPTWGWEVRSSQAFGGLCSVPG